MMMSVEQWWKLTEAERVVHLIRETGCSRLGNWDGCCCSHFSVRNVDVDISCGKGGEQAVSIKSTSIDYSSEADLEPVMAEVIRQVEEQSGRGGAFARYISVA